MGTDKVILVTGVAGFWGRRVAAKLLEAPGMQVIGLDPGEPDEKIQGLDFIQADIRNPLLLDLLKAEQVDTVCHLFFMEGIRPSEAAFDANVMGTMKLFAACREAGVRKIVLKSSTSVYGARPENPAFLKEDSLLNGSRAYGYTRDLVEIESFCNSFRRQAPETLLTILRFASIVGPEVDTPMSRFLSEPWAPVLLGFEPMMQVVHEQDVVGALVHAVLEDYPGVFNVAAEGVLPLRKLMALAGKLPLPVFHLLAYWGAAAVGGRLQGRDYWPIEPDYLRYAWVGDLERMRQELQFTPAYTAEEILREFSRRRRRRPLRMEKATLAYDEQRLRDTLERRSRQRQQAASDAGKEEAGND